MNVTIFVRTYGIKPKKREDGCMEIYVQNDVHLPANEKVTVDTGLYYQGPFSIGVIKASDIKNVDFFSCLDMDCEIQLRFVNKNPFEVVLSKEEPVGLLCVKCLKRPYVSFIDMAINMDEEDDDSVSFSKVDMTNEKQVLQSNKNMICGCVFNGDVYDFPRHELFK